ncbi:hypothetical protein BD311DRAFT_663838 [Dichomitus squalens]|uniref:Uncharacterized protein n=1 Tax=Dichomitus squalens TaxID=114155 RepID=A0A4Q9ML93_9APHY|nr:hypothetical protein BD311DRAFT_663838 [Dichomitus squalens]
MPDSLFSSSLPCTNVLSSFRRPPLTLVFLRTPSLPPSTPKFMPCHTSITEHAYWEAILVGFSPLSGEALCRTQTERPRCTSRALSSMPPHCTSVPPSSRRLRQAPVGAPNCAHARTDG